MSSEPAEIRAEISALLAELPDFDTDQTDLRAVDLDAVATRLEEAHEMLVQGLESVDLANVAAPGTDPVGDRESPREVDG